MTGYLFLMACIYLFASFVGYFSAHGVHRRLTKLIFSLTVAILLLTFADMLSHFAFFQIGWLLNVVLWLVMPTFYITLLIILFSHPESTEDDEKQESGDRGFLFNRL